MPTTLRAAYREHRQRRWRAAVLRKTLSGHKGIANGRYLTYLVKEGATNRLKAHIFAHALAEETGRTLVPCWYRNSECYATYTDLCIAQSSDDWRYADYLLVRYNETTDRADPELNLIRTSSVDLIVLDLSWQYARLAKLVDRLGGSADYKHKALASFSPQPDILDQVKKRKTEWRGTMIGVHARFGDFVDFRQAINVERYITATKRALIEHPGAGIFLSSDGSAEQLAPFFAAFQEQITHQTSLGRDNIAGVQHAFADILMLRDCDHLILTPHSGFGEFAARLGGVPFEYA